MKTQRSPSATWQHDNANQNGALWQRESKPPATSLLPPEKKNLNPSCLPYRPLPSAPNRSTSQPTNQPASFTSRPTCNRHGNTATKRPRPPQKQKNKQKKERTTCRRQHRHHCPSWKQPLPRRRRPSASLTSNHIPVLQPRPLPHRCCHFTFPPLLPTHTHTHT